MKKAVLSFIIALGVFTHAQVHIGEAANSKAVLEVNSEFLGVQFPRLTTKEIKEIKQPEEGLLVYNLTEQCLCINVGKTQPDWKCLVVYKPEEQ